jgi:formylglycine-generating enzyme required for sulfatase activity
MRDGPDYPEMVLVPAGTFIMGVPDSETKQEHAQYDDGARPLHVVTIKPFWLGRYPVTRGEYAAFINDRKDAAGGDAWRNPGFAQTDRDPVVGVSFADAEAYGVWLSAKTGKAYRLPSEAEWEYAARAGTTTARFWGDDRTLACQFANVADDTLRAKYGAYTSRDSYFECDDGYTNTSPVGKFQPNEFKLYDMLGNVSQWTADCDHPNYDGAPTDGTKWTTGNCSNRVLRGGSWIDGPQLLRAGVRHWGEPGLRGSTIGFRLARTL